MIKKEEKQSYHSSLSSKMSEKEDNKKFNKTIKQKNIVPKKIVIVNKKIKKNDEIKHKYSKSFDSKKLNQEQNQQKIYKNRINGDNVEEKKEKLEKLEKSDKNDEDEKPTILNDYQKPIIINDFPQDKHSCFLGNQSKKSNNKVITIYIFHREEIFNIDINNGLTINELVEQIIQNIKILKSELELLLIYDNIDNKTNLFKNKSFNSFIQKISSKKNIENLQKIKITNNNLQYLNDYYRNSKNYVKKKILIFPDNENKFENTKIKDLLKDKINYYIKANQVPKNKYNSFDYKKEIKLMNINTFINNINKEIEKNNITLERNNIRTINIENNDNKEENIGIKNKYKNIVIVEGINLISNFFFNEIQKYFNDNNIKENYDFKCVGLKRYIFGFLRSDCAYSFYKYVNNLKFIKSKFFHMKCKLKLFDINNKLHYNSIDKNSNNTLFKRKFYFSNKLDRNYNYFALKNNLKGKSNSYFLLNGQKKYILNDNDTDSMNEIILMNRFKFKNNNDFNYVNSDNFMTIPLI